MDMQKTVLILAGGKSLRFQYSDKCFISLNNKPLLQHVVDCVSNVADEIIVAARDEKQGEQIRDVIDNKKIRLVFDSVKGFGPLAGILSGFEQATYSYALVIGCDMPFVNGKVVEFLFEVAATGHDAVVPRWDNGMVEPLHAVYRREPMLRAIRDAEKTGDKKIFEILSYLKKVEFLSVNQLKVIDPNLKTFMNINTPDELKRSQI
ncbi:molybdopterin-guanine dinucleotide biosynthesis protein A [Candidatus Methanophagaceae archaeon]|nr:molybdopterin-guanine dinucleotide biosynthesis protein A [Methanophagales archaeon]